MYYRMLIVLYFYILYRMLNVFCTVVRTLPLKYVRVHTNNTPNIYGTIATYMMGVPDNIVSHL